MNASSRRPVAANLIGFKRGVHPKRKTSPSDGDVQSAMSPQSIKRTEIHRKPARRIFTERDGKIHHVPFVALHVLQIFHRRRFDPIVAEKPFQLVVIA